MVEDAVLQFSEDTARIGLENSMLHAFRLKPGFDLRESLEQWINENGIEAAAIVTCVGSLSTATLRMANDKTTTTLQGPFEIVSLLGTLSINGSHCHMAIADSTGRVVGGHVAYGCKIYTTAEIVITVLTEAVFLRLADAETGCRELVVRPRWSGPI